MIRNWLLMVMALQFVPAFSRGQEQLYLGTGYRPIYNITFSPDSKSVVTTSGSVGDRVMCVWSVGEKKSLQKFHNRYGHMFPQFSHSGNVIHSLMSKVDSAFFGWEVQESNVRTGERKVLYASNAPEKPVAFWMDMKIVVTEANESEAPKVGPALKFFDFGNEKTHVVPIHEPYTVMAFSPDRKLVAIRLGKERIRVIDWTNNKKISDLHTIIIGGYRCRSCLFLADNQTLAAVASPNLDLPTIHIWDTANGKLLKTIPFRGSPSHNPIISPDGRILAAYGSGVVLFETKTLAIVSMTKPANGVAVEALCFSPDGKMLMGGDRLGNLRTFDIPKLDRP